MAEKYAESARKLDSYNPHAFVNSGVCEMLRERYDIAKFMFNNALEIDASLFEALYNMGKFAFTLIPFIITCRVKCVWF
jgi:tetratricopeptide (TPR) repeat protein